MTYIHSYMCSSNINIYELGAVVRNGHLLASESRDHNISGAWNP